MRRGEILLDLRILDRWNDELERTNAGKEGGRYVYPEVFVRLLGYMRVLFHLPYRQTEGFLKALRRFDSMVLSRHRWLRLFARPRLDSGSPLSQLFFSKRRSACGWFDNGFTDFLH